MFQEYELPGIKIEADAHGVTFESCIIYLNNNYRIPAAHAEGALKYLLWLTAPLEESEDQTS